MMDENKDESPDLSGLALIALDIQEPFVRAFPRGEEFVSRCTLAVKAAQNLEIPVIFTEQVPEKLGHTLENLLAAAGSPTVFAKQRFSCFGAEGLDALLKEKDIHHLLIAGLETPICVYQSVIDAIDHGYEVTLLSDCVGARREEDASVVLRALAGAGAHVLPAETVIYSILGDTDHRCFREITSLVKNA